MKQKSDAKNSLVPKLTTLIGKKIRSIKKVIEDAMPMLSVLVVIDHIIGNNTALWLGAFWNKINNEIEKHFIAILLRISSNTGYEPVKPTIQQMSSKTLKPLMASVVQT